jgi:UDP-N-acetylglucosamine 1-carboxyvinyltransferase
VEGVPCLAPGREYTVIPDRMEAGTFACAAAITRGDVLLENVVPAHLQPVLVKLHQMGVTVEYHGADHDVPSTLRIASRGRCRAVDILAMPHPGFPTDMQQPMVALLSVSEGAAMVTDRVFENRFRYVSELQRMGADIRVEGRTAFVHGVERLTGASITGTDLRATAALVVAALAAEGETVITGVEHLDRGYGGMVEKLQSAGAGIRRSGSDLTPAPSILASL